MHPDGEKSLNFVQDGDISDSFLDAQDAKREDDPNSDTPSDGEKMVHVSPPPATEDAAPTADKESTQEPEKVVPDPDDDFWAFNKAVKKSKKTKKTRNGGLWADEE